MYYNSSNAAIKPVSQNAIWLPPHRPSHPAGRPRSHALLRSRGQLAAWLAAQEAGPERETCAADWSRERNRERDESRTL